MPFDLFFPENNIKNMRPHVDLMSACGFEVSEAEDMITARRLAAERKFHAAFVDDDMGGETGLSLIPAILEQNPDAKVVVFSAYKGPEDRERILRNFEISPDASLIVKSKSQARISTGKFEALVREVHEACSGSSKLNLETEFDIKQIKKFNISFSKYEDMSPEQRADVEREFKQANKDRIKKQVQNRKYIWALYCGSDRSPIAVATKPSEIWDYRQVLKEAEKRKKFPFQVVMNGLSEDGGGVCGFPQFSGYPKIAFQFDGQQTPDGSVIEAHLDTGTQEVYLNGKHLLESGWLTEAPTTIPYELNGTEMDVARLRDVKIEVQNRGDRSDAKRPTVEFSAWAVFSPWEDVPLFARCALAREMDYECDRKSANNVCVYRTLAFFGRNIFIEPQHHISICPTTSFVSLSR